MIARIYISGRPPVTTLYQAALFIGWAGVAIGLILELIYRLGIGTLINPPLPDSLRCSSRNILPQPAKASQHVYRHAGRARHAVLARDARHLHYAWLRDYLHRRIHRRRDNIIKGVFSPSLSPELSKSITHTIYGVLCFAIFFSFVGTVLGGLWADLRGRFWGWDPKENAGLIIVIWNCAGAACPLEQMAAIADACWRSRQYCRRLVGLRRERTRGAGLHSYGFTSGVAVWLSIFVVSQLG